MDVGPAGSARTVDGHGAYKGRWESRAKPLTSAQKADPEQLPLADIPTGAFLVDGNGGEYVFPGCAHSQRPVGTTPFAAAWPPCVPRDPAALAFLRAALAGCVHKRAAT